MRRKKNDMSIGNNLTKYLDSLPQKESLLEFGSGDGTKRLADSGYSVYSIEHDPKYVSSSSEAVCLSPLEGDWYNHNQVAQFIITHMPFSVCLIDGPCKPSQEATNYRDGILAHWRLLQHIPIIIADDIHRQEGLDVAVGLAAMLEKNIGTISDGNKQFGIIS